MAAGTFGTAINCMDGRVQEPVANWMKEKFSLNFIDAITEPGPDKILAAGAPEQIESILNRVKISVEKHGSKHIVITGHHDCAGNPVTKEEHLQHVLLAMQVIRKWELPANIYGLWIDDNWKVELIDKIVRF